MMEKECEIKLFIKYFGKFCSLGFSKKVATKMSLSVFCTQPIVPSSRDGKFVPRGDGQLLCTVVLEVHVHS